MLAPLSLTVLMFGANLPFVCCMPQQRKTPQRELIASVLNQTERPLLPKEILAIAQQSLPTLGIATVFRAVKDLVADGRASMVNIGDEPPRYEGVRGHHHHFKCMNCGEVFDLFKCPGNLENLLPPGFMLIDHDITLFGKCDDCLKAE